LNYVALPATETVLLRLAEDLMIARIVRLRGPEWVEVCSGVRYQCPFLMEQKTEPKGEVRNGAMFPTQRDLLVHLQMVHRIEDKGLEPLLSKGRVPPPEKKKHN